jgi:hypothetical protein
MSSVNSVDPVKSMRSLNCYADNPDRRTWQVVSDGVALVWVVWCVSAGWAVYRGIQRDSPAADEPAAAPDVRRVDMAGAAAVVGGVSLVRGAMGWLFAAVSGADGLPVEAGTSVGVTIDRFSRVAGSVRRSRPNRLRPTRLPPNRPCCWAVGVGQVPVRPPSERRPAQAHSGRGRGHARPPSLDRAPRDRRETSARTLVDGFLRRDEPTLRSSAIVREARGGGAPKRPLGRQRSAGKRFSRAMSRGGWRLQGERRREREERKKLRVIGELPLKEER